MEENVILEDVMSTKRIKGNKFSFDTYSVPKTIAGGYFFSNITKEKVLLQEGRVFCKNEVLMTD